MEQVRINPKEKIWRKTKPIHAPSILWLGYHPLITYPGQEEGLPTISFADADGGKGYATTFVAPITLGRSRRNTLTFNNDLTSISGTHARINLEDNVWHVEDCNSTNGTFIEEISTCPRGEIILPKRTWYLIPDGYEQQITFGTYLTNPSTNNPVLTLSTYPEEMTVLQIPTSERIIQTIMPLHQPIQIGRELKNDIFLANEHVAPSMHATIINTGNGVLIRDNTATHYTKVKNTPHH